MAVMAAGIVKVSVPTAEYVQVNDVGTVPVRAPPEPHVPAAAAAGAATTSIAVAARDAPIRIETSNATVV
jgi:hypothetical protein